MTQKLIENGTGKSTRPAWEAQLRREFLTARTKHMFLLHGNVADYVEGERDLRTHLRIAFSAYPVVIVYNRAEGLIFSDEIGKEKSAPEEGAPPSMRQQFAELCGLAQLAGSDAQALAELGGGGGNGEVEFSRDPIAALPYVDQALRQRAVKVAVIMDYAESLVPAGNVAHMNADDRTLLILLQRWAIDPQIAANGHPVILIAANLADLHPDLKAPSSRLSVIEVPIPNFEDRLAYVQALAAANERRPEEKRWALEIDPAEFARLTAGLGRVHLGEIILHALGSGDPVNQKLVLGLKAQFVAAQFSAALEIREPTVSYDDFGGLEHIKEWHRWAVIEPMRDGRYEDAPMGVLYTGPAGTGKSRFAEATAKEAGLQFCSFSPSKVYGGIVGETEKNTDRIFRLCVAMAPTLLFIDEIEDQVTEGGTGDSGVSQRVFGALKEFMADQTHRGKVIVIAASNRPSRIAPALKRPGRMDAKIPFLSPEKDERVKIVAVHMRQLFGKAAPDVAMDVAARTEGYTGAELFRLTQKAAELLKRKRTAGIGEAYSLALETLLPSTNAIHEMTLEALAEMDDLDLIPERLRGLAKKLRAQKPAAAEKGKAGDAPTEERIALTD